MDYWSDDKYETSLIANELGDSAVTGAFSLEPGFAMQIYAAFGITGVIFILFLNYAWLQKWSRSRSRNYQFSLLEDSIDNIIKNHDLLSLEFESQYISFVEKIKQFKVYVPPRTETIKPLFSNQPDYQVIRREWMDWVVSMKAFSATSNLKAARRYSAIATRDEVPRL